MKKYETSVLREEYLSIFEKIDQIEDYNDEVRALEKRADEIREILIPRYRAAIYKAACRVLRNNCRYPRNQFSMAAQFADAVINGSEIFAETEHYEIGSYYTKNHCPEIVYFD